MSPALFYFYFSFISPTTNSSTKKDKNKHKSVYFIVGIELIELAISINSIWLIASDTM